MSMEAAVSLFAAWRARSPALLAFGGDSAIELLSALVVLWRFRSNAAKEHAERRAAHIAGILLFALGACIVAASTVALLGYNQPKPTLMGIAILIAAAVFMPLLASKKRRLSAQTGSAALRADAAESALCGYLSLIALVGLVVNTIGHVAWADSAAALAIVPFVLWEGREALPRRMWDPVSSRSIRLPALEQDGDSTPGCRFGNELGMSALVSGTRSQPRKVASALEQGLRDGNLDPETAGSSRMACQLGGGLATDSLISRSISLRSSALGAVGNASTAQGPLAIWQKYQFPRRHRNNYVG
jgi:hypothetical protein